MRSGPGEEEALPKHWLNRVRGCNSGSHRSSAALLTRAWFLFQRTQPATAQPPLGPQERGTKTPPPHPSRAPLLGIEVPKGCIHTPLRPQTGACTDKHLCLKDLG